MTYSANKSKSDNTYNTIGTGAQEPIFQREYRRTHTEREKNRVMKTTDAVHYRISISRQCVECHVMVDSTNGDTLSKRDLFAPFVTRILLKRKFHQNSFIKSNDMNAFEMLTLPINEYFPVSRLSTFQNRLL